MGLPLQPQNTKELLTKEQVKVLCEAIASDLKSKLPNTPVNLVLNYYDKNGSINPSFDGELEVGDVDSIHVRFKPKYSRIEGDRFVCYESSRLFVRRWSQDYNQDNGEIDTLAMAKEAKIMLDLAEHMTDIKKAMHQVCNIVYHFNNSLDYRH